jgi:hypothetical protein
MLKCARALLIGVAYASFRVHSNLRLPPTSQTDSTSIYYYNACGDQLTAYPLITTLTLCVQQNTCYSCTNTWTLSVNWLKLHHLKYRACCVICGTNHRIGVRSDACLLCAELSKSRKHAELRTYIETLHRKTLLVYR